MNRRLLLRAVGGIAAAGALIAIPVGAVGAAPGGIVPVKIVPPSIVPQASVLPPLAQLLPAPVQFNLTVAVTAGSSATKTVTLSNASTIAALLARPDLTASQRQELEAIPTTASDTVRVLTVAQAAALGVTVPTSTGTSTSSGAASGPTANVAVPEASGQGTLVVQATPTCNHGIYGSTWFHTYTGWVVNNSPWSVVAIDPSNMYTGTALGYALSGNPTSGHSVSGGTGTAWQFAAFSGTWELGEFNESFRLQQQSGPGTGTLRWTYANSIAC